MYKRISILLVAGILVAAGLFASFFVMSGTNVYGQSFSGTVSHVMKEAKKELAAKTVLIEGKKFTLQELGVSYDEDTLKTSVENARIFKAAFNSDNKNITPTLVVDDAELDKVISESLPEIYRTPSDATVTFDGNSNKWVFGDAVNGTMPNSENFVAKLEEEMKNGSELSYDLESVSPILHTDTAEKTAAQLNQMADGEGFTVEGETKVPLSTKEISEMIKIVPDGNGFTVKPVADKIHELVNSLPDKVNSDSDDGSAVVDENGKVLKVLDEWTDGFTMKDSEDTEKKLSEALSEKTKISVALNGDVKKAKVNELFRKAVVDQTARQAYFYENGKLVMQFPVAVGKAATPTDTGNFHVQAQYVSQDMGCSARFDYCTPDVPWISYFNGDEGFHGTYWHNDFGNPNASRQSHGCVNMRVADAEKVYRFLQVGSPVEVHW